MRFSSILSLQHNPSNCDTATTTMEQQQQQHDDHHHKGEVPLNPQQHLLNFKKSPNNNNNNNNLQNGSRRSHGKKMKNLRKGSLVFNTNHSKQRPTTPRLANRSQTTFEVLLPPLRQQRHHPNIVEHRRATTGPIGVKLDKKESLIAHIQDRSESNSIHQEYLRFPLHVDVPPTLSCDVMELRDMNPSQTVDVNISMALTDYSRSMYQAAIHRLTRTLLKHHRNAFIPHFIRGICHYHMNEYDLAKHDFSACCCTIKDGSERQEYDRALAFFNRSVVWMKMNDASKAMEDVNKAIEIYPFEKAFFCNRAILYRRRGKFEAAQYDYKAIRRLESEEMKELDNCVVRKSAGGKELVLSPTKKKKKGDIHLLPPRRHALANNCSGSGSGSGQSSVGRIRKTLIGRRTIQGNKSPSAKRPRSLLDMKTSAYGQVHSALTCQPQRRTRAQLDVLVKESRMMSAFAHLDIKQLTTLWKYLEYQSFPSNTRLFNEGDVAEEYMLVWSGSVSARVRKRNTFMKHSDNVASALAMEREFTINTMEAGETLDEAIMLEGEIRKASCVTEEPSEILVLKKEHFHQTFHIFLQKAHDEKVDFLSSFNFLSGWSREKLNELAHLCREKRYHRGETIIRQNDETNSFYFVKTGMLSVVRKVDCYSSSCPPQDQTSSQFCVSKLSSGDIFGEATILSESEFSVFPTSIVSETLSICFRLDKVQLDENHWDANSKRKLAERVVIFQDDETLKKTKSDETKMKKQSDLIVRKVRHMIRSKNIIKKFSR